MKRSILKKIVKGAAAALAITALTGCSTNKIASEDYAQTVVATYGDETIYLSEPVFFLRSNQWYTEMLFSGYYSDMKAYWNSEQQRYKTMGDSLKEDSMAAVLQTRILASNAGAYGVELTEEDKLKISEAVTSFFAGGSEDIIAATGITEETLTDIYTNNAIANKVWEAMTATVDTNVSDEEARQAAIDTIQVDEDPDDPEWAKNAAQDMLSRAQAGEDLETIAYDYDFVVNPKTLGADETIELNTTAMSLKVGESALVNNDDKGYYVILCTSELDEVATQTRKDAIISERKDEIFKTLYENLKATAPELVVVDKVWSSINFDAQVYVAVTTSAQTTAQETSAAETSEEETDTEEVSQEETAEEESTTK